MGSVILSLFLPPLGVWWRFGCNLDVLICAVLTLLFHLPGAVYAVAILALKEPEGDSSVSHRQRGGSVHRTAPTTAEGRRLLECRADVESGHARVATRA